MVAKQSNLISLTYSWTLFITLLKYSLIQSLLNPKRLPSWNEKCDTLKSLSLMMTCINLLVASVSDPEGEEDKSRT